MNIQKQMVVECRCENPPHIVSVNADSIPFGGIWNDEHVTATFWGERAKENAQLFVDTLNRLIIGAFPINADI